MPRETAVSPPFSLSTIVCPSQPNTSPEAVSIAYGDKLAVIAPSVGDHIAVIGENRKLLAQAVQAGLAPLAHPQGRALAGFEGRGAAGLLVVVAIPVIARAGAWVMGARLGAACVALGWALPTIAFVLAGPGGDVLLPDVTRTWIYLVGTTLLLVLAVALPLPRGARELAETRGLGVPDA